MRKIPTLFVRDFSADNGRYVTREVNPGCEWVLDGDGVPTRKLDGTCVMVDHDGRLWARREVKRGKQFPGIFQELETDSVTGKAVGWEPAEFSGYFKFIREAADAASELPSGTYELVGPKVNGNPEQVDSHRLMPHGATTVDLPGRSYDDLAKWTAAHPEVEGIVFWRQQGNPNGGMVKIKRRDFRS